MANYVNDNYETLADVDGNGDGITNDEINEVILSYYDAYIAAGGSTDELPDELPDGFIDTLPGNGNDESTDENDA